MKKNQMNQIECQFCNKVFGNNQLLHQHQKKTKYCLNIQNIFFSENPQMTIKEYKKKVDFKDKQKIKCQFCNSIFASIILLDQHQKRAKHCLKIQEIKAKEEAESDAKFLEESKVKEIEATQKKEAEELILKQKIKDLTCQFCSKEFKTKYLLNIHQTQAKYCLKIQESQNSQEIISLLIKCKFCGKNSSASNSVKHDLLCKKKIQFLTDEISRLKTEKYEEISRLKIEKEKEISSIYKASAEYAHASAERAHSAIEEIAKQPTYQKNSTRNIQNNLMISNLTPLDLSQARVNSIIDEKYTKNDFYEGQKGAAQVIHKYLSTDSNGKSQIVCTDTERGTFHHIDVNGEHVVDYKNVYLIDRVHLPLKRKASKFASEECVKNPTAYKDIVMNETSIRELESKPGLFNRTMAQLTGKKCVRPLSVKSSSNIDLSITKEWLLENTKFLTIEHILRGPEGFADYALSYPLNDRLIEEDYLNPGFLKYKDISGNIITDYGGKMLSKMFFDSVKERTYELIDSNKNITFKYGSIEDSIFQDEFISIVISNI
jgi:hypothetical protein